MSISKLDLIHEALVATRAIPNAWHRSRALRGLVRLLPDELLAEALTIARDSPEAGARARALNGLAVRLSADLKATVLNEALAAIRQVPSLADRASVLNGVTQQLTGETRISVAHEVLEATRGVTDALACARELAALPDEVLVEATAAARALTDAWAKAEALAALAYRYPPEEQDALVAETLAIVDTLPEADQQVSVWSALVRQSVDPLKATLTAKILQRAPILSDDGVRLWSVVQPLCDQAELEALLAVARAIGLVPRRITAFSLLIPRASASLTMEAFRLIPPLNDDWQRSDALSDLAEFLPEDVLPTALSIAHALTDAWAKSEALSVLASRLNGDEQRRTQEAALEAARSAPTAWAKARALTGVAGQWVNLSMSDA